MKALHQILPQNIMANAICNVEFCVNRDEVSSISMKLVPNMSEQWETSWTEFLHNFIKEFVSPEYIPIAFHTFSRENLLESYKNGKNELQKDLIFSFANDEDLWGKVYAYLIDDEKGDVYCNFYINDITAEKRAELSLKQKAELDPMTTLYNRAYAESIINSSIKNAVLPGAFIILDIDNFKQVNDSMSFGPKLVIVVVGANKIVQDEAAGRKRIKLQAAPMNATRLSCKTPCVSTGICMDCNSPERICMITSILHMAPRGSDFHIIVVGETLGY